jgi:hypothetical protein
MGRRRKSYYFDMLIGFMILMAIIMAAIGSGIEWVRVHQQNVIAIATFVIGLYILKKLINFFRNIKKDRDIKKQNVVLQQKYNIEIQNALKQQSYNNKILYAVDTGIVWKGQSAEQLIGVIGKPVAVDSRVLKTKTKEIWKYLETRKNQFALKIIIENNTVVGWEKKDN